MENFGCIVTTLFGTRLLRSLAHPARWIGARAEGTLINVDKRAPIQRAGCARLVATYKQENTIARFLPCMFHGCKHLVTILILIIILMYLCRGFIASHPYLDIEICQSHCNSILLKMYHSLARSTQSIQTNIHCKNVV